MPEQVLMDSSYLNGKSTTGTATRVSDTTKPQKISEIPINKVKPNGFGLRKLNENVVKELAESIMASGLLQPIMVTPSGDDYEIVFGLHRFEACKRLDWKKIPALVKDISSEVAFLTGLIENLQRNIRINPVAEAHGYKWLMAKGWGPHDIARKIGKSDSYVYDRLRVLNRLHPAIQRQLSTHVCNSPITPSHAERLALIDDPQLQLKLAKQVRKNHLSVHQLEHLTWKAQPRMPKGCMCEKCPNYPCKYLSGQNHLNKYLNGKIMK